MQLKNATENIFTVSLSACKANGFWIKFTSQNTVGINRNCADVASNWKQSIFPSW